MAERSYLGWFHLGLIATTSVLFCLQIGKVTSNDVNEPTDEYKIYIKQNKKYKCVLTTCMEIPIGGEENGIIGNPEENNNDTSLFEGDIVSPPVIKGVAESRYRYRNALNMADPDMSAWYERWYFKANREPRGKVFYDFDSSLSSKQKNDILSAMEEIQIKSGGVTSKCIQFIPNSGNSRDHLVIKSRSSSCQSSGIGKDKEVRRPYINLGPSCFVIGTIMHELLHAIGFFHEHVRNDRDDYIEIVTSNIRSGYSSQFKKPEYSTDLKSHSPYDYDSVMHYGKYTFSKNAGRGLETIRVKRSTDFEIGQRDHLSKGDIEDLQKMYSCPDIGVAAGEESATPPDYLCSFEAGDVKCGFINGHSSIWKPTPVSRIGAKYYDATFNYPNQNIGNVLYMAPGSATTDALFTANVPPADYCLQINYFCYGSNSKAQVYSGMEGTKKLLYTLPSCKDFTWYYTWMGVEMSTSGTIEIHGLRANIGHFLLDDIKLMEKPANWKDCNQ